MTAAIDNLAAWALLTLVLGGVYGVLYLIARVTMPLIVGILVRLGVID